MLNSAILNDANQRQMRHGSRCRRQWQGYTHKLRRNPERRGDCAVTPRDASSVTPSDSERDTK
eukprot:2654981-Pyramimonas_sp.AAC.2